MSDLSYVEAVIVGALQGVTELFPVSSLGHSVLLPALVGGAWQRDLNVSAPESPYLAFIVGTHVATAAALLTYYWRDWLRIIGGFVTSLRYLRVETPNERLAWLIGLATIPVGLTGLLLEHTFRTTLGRPVPAACFLIGNGLLLGAGERLRRRGPTTAAHRALFVASTAAIELQAPPRLQAQPDLELAADERLSRLTAKEAVAVGTVQTLALLPGISRSGITMVVGLTRGLSHEDAARFSFLLATPVILAAGVLKVPDLFGPLGSGIGSQILAGSLTAFLTAYLAVRSLSRWFHTGTLIPFAVYSVLAGSTGLVVLFNR